MSAIEVFVRIQYNIVRNRNIRTNTLRGGVSLKRKLGIILYLLLAVVIGVLCSFAFFAFSIYLYGFSIFMLDLFSPNIPLAIFIGIATVAGVAIYLFIGKRFIKNGRIVALALVLILVTACLYPYVMDLKSEIGEKNAQKYAATHESPKVTQANQDLMESKLPFSLDLENSHYDTLYYERRNKYNYLRLYLEKTNEGNLTVDEVEQLLNLLPKKQEGRIVIKHGAGETVLKFKNDPKAQGLEDKIGRTDFLKIYASSEESAVVNQFNEILSKSNLPYLLDLKGSHYATLYYQDRLRVFLKKTNGEGLTLEEIEQLANLLPEGSNGYFVQIAYKELLPENTEDEQKENTITIFFDENKKCTECYGDDRPFCKFVKLLGCLSQKKEDNIYEFIDIDADGIPEVVVKRQTVFSYSQEKHDQNMRIYRYQNKKDEYSLIFEQSLFGDELVYFIEPDYTDIHGITTPYTYKNSYEFVPNKENPHLLDLVFKIETQPPELWGKWEKEGYDLFYEPVKDTVVFSFNGSEYVPNKEVYNYKQPEKTNTKKYTKNYTKIDYEHIPNLETDTLKNLLANLFTNQEKDHPYVLINRMTIEDVKPLDIFSNGKFKKAYLIHGIIYCNLDEQYGTHLVAVLEEKTDFENNKKDYKLVFNCENYKVSCELIDIDTDGGQEILIRDEGFGSPAFGPYYKDMKIYQYQENQFLCIFDEGLYWEDYDGLGKSNLGKPNYNFYQNSYKFVPNKESSHLLDIVFNIESQPQELLKGWVKDFKPLYESVKDTVTFTFNGEKYEPNKDFYDYRNPKAIDN